MVCNNKRWSYSGKGVNNLIIENKMLLYLMEKYVEIRIHKKTKKDPHKIADVDFYYDIDHAQGAFIKKDDQVCLLIMGSNEWKDWLYNGFIFTKKIKPYDVQSNVKVHHGFYKSYLCIRNVIHNYIQSNNIKSLIVMGQSHGAAVAILASLDIKYNFNIDIIPVLTGCPKVGNEDFMKSYEKRIQNIYRLRYGSDFIPKLLPEFFGFKHIGKESHYGPEDTFLRNLTIIKPIKDHLLHNGMIEEFKNMNE